MPGPVGRRGGTLGTDGWARARRRGPGVAGADGARPGHEAGWRRDAVPGTRTGEALRDVPPRGGLVLRLHC